MPALNLWLSFVIELIGVKYKSMIDLKANYGKFLKILVGRNF